MRENQLPVNYTSAEETGPRQATDSGDGGVHISREPVTDVEARPSGNYMADDLSNSVQITLAHFPAAGSAPGASAVSIASPALSGPRNQHVAYYPDDSTELNDPEGFTELDDSEGSTELDDPEGSTELDEARGSKSETWLLAAAAISVTALFTALYTIRNPEWVPSFVGQTVKISKQLSADIKRRAITALGGTAITDTAKVGAGTVAGAEVIHGAPTGRNSASAVQSKSETAMYGAHVTPASGGEMLPALSQQSKPITNSPMDFMNQGSSHRVASPVTVMSKDAEANTSKSKKNYLVPPPPPTPYVLPPGFGFLPTQPAQLNAAVQQQLQQAQAQASPKTHNQDAARENTPQQSTAASGKTEAAQSAALVDADRELQAALKSSLHTVGEWTR